MAQLIASKVAKVRRTVGALPQVATFTDRDWRHLIHSCEGSPRRAIRTVKAGEQDHFLAVYREEVTQPEPQEQLTADAGKKSLSSLVAQLS